jgi:hypothetical protein
MGCDNIFSDNFVDHLKRYIGETVTIFTTSGGQSGQGFTGVVLAVNDCFVRLITRIGSAPGCALGNACNNNYNRVGGYSNNRCCDRDYNNCYCNKNYNSGSYNHTLGSVTDIPIDRIASFVHNAV